MWRALVGKQEMREQLAALSFSEKVKILEKLRDRSLMFAEARRTRKEAKDSVGAALRKSEK